MPTASQVLITAEILCGSKTFSKTIVISSCLLSNTEVNFFNLSGVIINGLALYSCLN